MSLGQTIQLRVVRDDLNPSLQRLIALKPERVTKVMGIEGQKLTRRHLLGKGTNKRGWPSTRFWSRAAKKTTATNTPRAAVISVRQIGVAQRYHGGPIRPHRKQALTIPINRMAYGKVASDFPDLFLLKAKKGAYLVQPGQGNALQFLFKLSKGVVQKPDPTVLPASRTMHEAVSGGVTKLILREHGRRN